MLINSTQRTRNMARTLYSPIIAWRAIAMSLLNLYNTSDRRQCVFGNSQGQRYRQQAKTTRQAKRPKMALLRPGPSGHGILSHGTSLRR
jgi:hypothetical protein